MNNKVLIINHWYMSNVGGIEAYVSDLVRYSCEQNIRVIWLYKGKGTVGKSFQDVLCSEKVEKYNINSLFRFGHDFGFKYNDEIVIISFYPIAMGVAEKFIYKFSGDARITPFYVVANTTGNYYYIERYFSFLKPLIYKSMKRMMERWEKGNNIRFCAPLHIDYLEKNYNLRISQREAKVLKEVYEFPILDIENLKKRSDRNIFNLITIGRFDFPHKGYILGLIRAYGRLKSKYSKLKLNIIGYGAGEQAVRKEINDLPEAYRKDIALLGEVPPHNLIKYLCDSHLNISVAGAVSQGAKYGVLSIPARNFCDGECEVYGFLPESASKTVSLETGNLVDPYIEAVINMSRSEYIDKSIASYEAIKSRSTETAEPMYFFNTLKLCNKKFECSLMEIRLLSIFSLLLRIKIRLKMISHL